MQDTLFIEIPRDAALSTRLTVEELRLELAIHLFERHKLSFGKACEMARLSAFDFYAGLAQRKIPLHYAAEEYQEDKLVLLELRDK